MINSKRFGFVVLFMGLFHLSAQDTLSNGNALNFPKKTMASVLATPMSSLVFE